MIKVIAIDDEPLALLKLATFIQKIPTFELVGQFKSAIEARNFLDSEDVDAIFCDINMPGLNGMDFIKSLSSAYLVVFTTAYSEYAVDGYKVEAVDYLLKPFGLDDFKRAAEHVEKAYRLRHAADQDTAAPSTVIKHDDDRNLYFKTDYRIVRLGIDNIVYIEAMSEYVKIHLRNDKSVVVLVRLKNLLDRLPSSFMRIHRSYIINLNAIVEVNKNRVIVEGDVFLPIGDSYRDAFNEYIRNRFIQ